jgi:hypothetical protein
MTVAIDIEPFNDALLAEIMPLAQKCWNESTTVKGESCAFYGERDFDIEPCVELYQNLHDNGAMVIVTLRDDGVLRGYVEGFVYRSLHHGKVKGGIGDSVYIEPNYRVYAGVLTKRFEDEMQARGVGIIGWPTQLNGPVYGVLKAMGYTGDDIVMEKRLCASQQQ